MNPVSRDAVYRDLHGGQLLQQDAQNRSSALAILTILFEYVRPQSILDVGCGLGAWLSAAQSLGVPEVRGVEGHWLDASQLRVDRALVAVCDLERAFSFQRTFDLVLCLEVAEHLPESAAETLIASLTAHGDLVLFSAAIPFQGGHHHVNEQFPDYWRARFARHGFRPLDFIRPRIWDDPAVLWWLRQNLLLFAHERTLAANERLRQEAAIPRLLSVVHPSVYLDRLQPVSRTLSEHAALVGALAQEGAYQVTKSSQGSFSITRLGPTVRGALAAARQHHVAGRLHAAESIYQQVLEMQPDQPDAIHLLGLIAFQEGRHEAAVARYERALQLKPDLASAHNNLGIALKEQGKLQEAIASFERAVQLQPDYADAHYNLGTVMKDQGRLGEAVPSLQRALEIRPDYAMALNNLGNVFKDQGRLPEAVACFTRALQLQPTFVEVHSNLLYTLYFSPDSEAEAVLDEHRRWNARHAAPLARLIQPHANDRSPDRRLRIGYVSPNFREHSQTFFTAPLLSAHDHRSFEIFCYADVVVPDEFTLRLRSHADVWRNTVGLDDEQVARLIRQDRIDVLVDLSMHMAQNRLLMFARKPSPVQVCWLAYQGTTGLDAMDYRLTDSLVDPPGLFDRFYSEQSIRLPDSFGCYDPLTDGPAVSALPALEQGRITFASLNNFCKVNRPTLKLWALAVNAVPGSHLLILAPDGPHRESAREVLAQEGVHLERVLFLSSLPRARYLELYHRIDVSLDALPYNGQTTSLDSLWMGVPVVTLAGCTAVGRAGLSLLRTLGLGEWVAETPDEFGQIAARWGNDLPRLAGLRASLRERMQASPLMDASRFARGVEAACRTMWRAWCARNADGAACRPADPPSRLSRPAS